MARWSKGDYVQTIWDTGARGPTILYGIVEKAGPATVTIRWESGLTNRVTQGYVGVKTAHDTDDARQAMQKALR